MVNTIGSQTKPGVNIEGETRETCKSGAGCPHLSSGSQVCRTRIFYYLCVLIIKQII